MKVHKIIYTRSIDDVASDVKMTRKGERMC